MDKVENLIAAMGKCIPELDTAPLYENPPVNIEQLTILDWLYQHLSEQNLIEYEEWSEYSGYIPELKPLAAISLPQNPSDFIFSIIEKIDWSVASIDPFEVPYVMPWLEHINYYLQPHNLRLVNLMPFESAYIICVRDNEALLKEFDTNLSVFDIGINERAAMNQHQVSDDIKMIISG